MGGRVGLCGPSSTPHTWYKNTRHPKPPSPSPAPPQCMPHLCVEGCAWPSAPAGSIGVWACCRVLHACGAHTHTCTLPPPTPPPPLPPSPGSSARHARVWRFMCAHSLLFCARPGPGGPAGRSGPGGAGGLGSPLWRVAANVLGGRPRAAVSGHLEAAHTGQPRRVFGCVRLCARVCVATCNLRAARYKALWQRVRSARVGGS